MAWDEEKELRYQELAKKYGKNISTPKNKAAPLSSENKDISKWEAFGGSALSSLKSTGYGVQQLAQEAGQNPFYNPLGFAIGKSPESVMRDEQELSQKYAANRQQQDEYFQAHPWTSIGGSIVGDLPLAALGGGVTAPAKGLSYGKKILDASRQGARAGAVGGGAIGGLQYAPEGQSRAENSLIGAGVGGALGGTLGGAFSAVSPANIMKGLRGNVSDEQLSRNINAAQGTETGLGRILENPALMAAQENVLKYIPFSGYGASTQRTRSEIEKRGEDLLTKTTGNASKTENINEELQKELQNYEKQLRKKEEQDFLDINSRYEKSGQRPETKNIHETSSMIKGQLNEGRMMPGEQPRGLVSDINRYIDKSKPSEIKTNSYFDPVKMMQTTSSTLENTTPETLKGLGLFRSTLGEKSFKSKMGGDRFSAQKYGQLKGAVDKDIFEAIEKTGDTELKGMFDDAIRFYKENIGPTELKKVQKFIKDKDLTMSEGIISTFVKMGSKQDSSKTLGMLTDKLSPKGLDRLRYSLFSDNQGNVDAQSMLKAFNGLGQKQKNMLFPDKDIRKNMDELNDLSRLNPDAFNQMFNPKTGYGNRMLEAMQVYMPKAATGALAILGLADPSSALMAAGGLGVSRYANALLSSPKMREVLTKKIIEDESQKMILNKFLPSAKVFGGQFSKNEDE